MGKKNKKARSSRANSTDEGKEDTPATTTTTPQKEAMDLDSPKTTSSKKSKKNKHTNRKDSLTVDTNSNASEAVAEQTDEPLAPPQKPVLMGYELLGQSSQGYLQPLVTSFVAGQRFVILPQKQFLTILSYNTGQRIGTLVLEASPKNNKNDHKTPQGAANVMIECVTLATRPLVSDKSAKSSSLTNIWKRGAASANLQVLLVGCSDGSIREFAIAELVQPPASKSRLFDAGDFLLVAPIYTPKHVYQVAPTGKKVEYMSFGHETRCNIGRSSDRIGYAMVQSEGDKTSKLIRIQLPSAPSSMLVNLQESTDKNKSITVVHPKIRHSGVDGKASQSPMVALLATSEDFVILVQARQIRIFDFAKKAHASYKIPATDPITAAAMHHGSHLACGHVSGKIKVLHEFGLVYQRHFSELQKAQKLSSHVLPPTVIERTVHWHAHAVSSLSFESDSVSDEPFLFSGGTESVLVGWQLARGVDRPNWTLPRLASADIVHVLHVSGDSPIGQTETVPTTTSSNGTNNAVLVYCKNGTCILIQTHNRRVQWKVDSLVQSSLDRSTSNSLEENHSMRIRNIPNKDGSIKVAFFGSHSTSGHIQLLDPDTTHFSSSAIEVAPYNRTSRTDSDQADLPRPRVALADFNAKGDMITFDEVATEINAPIHGQSIFAPLKLRNRSTSSHEFGLERHLRFWHDNRVVAELSNPHGLNNSVDAIAISQTTGALACTVSTEGKCIQVWQKEESESSSSDPDTGSVSQIESPDWRCRYKIVVPSEFSGLESGSQAVAFSNDDSLLAIGFGGWISLWDIKAQAILAALPHFAGKKKDTIIESIAFTPTSSRQQDMLLTWSKHHVVFQSPFGHKSMVDQGWSWEVDPEVEGEMTITGAEYVCCHSDEEFVAVTVFHQSTQKSVLVLLDAETGKIQPRERVKIPGNVVDICSLTPSPQKSLSRGWGTNGDLENDVASDRGLDFAFVVEGGFAYRWTRGQETDQGATQKAVEGTSKASAASALPATPIVFADHLAQVTRKRKMAPRAMTTLDLSDKSDANKQKLSLENFGHVEGAEKEEELPLLRGAFAHAFLARHLYKKQKN